MWKQYPSILLLNTSNKAVIFVLALYVVENSWLQTATTTGGQSTIDLPSIPHSVLKERLQNWQNRPRHYQLHHTPSEMPDPLSANVRQIPEFCASQHKQTSQLCLNRSFTNCTGHSGLASSSWDSNIQPSASHSQWGTEAPAAAPSTSASPTDALYNEHTHIHTHKINSYPSPVYLVK